MQHVYIYVCMYVCMHVCVCVGGGGGGDAWTKRLMILKHHCIRRHAALARHCAHSHTDGKHSYPADSLGARPSLRLPPLRLSPRLALPPSLTTDATDNAICGWCTRRAAARLRHKDRDSRHYWGGGGGRQRRLLGGRRGSMEHSWRRTPRNNLHRSVCLSRYPRNGTK